MWRIGKTLTFEAAHHLPDLPEGHKCRRPHGHSYTVEVDMRADLLDDRGFVEDYGMLSEVVKALDHQDLNELLAFAPTAENLAAHLFTLFSGLARVGVTVERVVVAETATSWAEFKRGGS